MLPTGLEWAQRIRSDLVIRIENLQAALADIEPLRQELERLQSQLKGIERLIAVYYDELGYPRINPHGESATAGQIAAAPEAPLLQSSQIGEQAPAAPVEVPAFVYRALALASAARRRTRHLAAMGREAFGRRLLAARRQLAKLRARPLIGL